MLQGTPGRRVSEFYDHHPISEAGVLAALARRGRGLPEGPTVDDLFEFDQDHYGGLAAVDALASRAGVGAQSRVLDVCAGLGGPARFLSRRRGSKVVALELHAGRALGATRLNRLVGETRVAVVRGDATRLPFGFGAFDVCLSQEALLHIADKPAVLRECHRVLAPGGRLATSTLEALEEVLDPFFDFLTAALSDDRRRIDPYGRRRRVAGCLRPDHAAPVVHLQVRVHAPGRKAVLPGDPDLHGAARVQQIARGEDAVGDLPRSRDRVEVDRRGEQRGRQVRGEQRRHRAAHAHDRADQGERLGTHDLAGTDPEVSRAVEGVEEIRAERHGTREIERPGHRVALAQVIDQHALDRDFLEREVAELHAHTVLERRRQVEADGALADRRGDRAALESVAAVRRAGDLQGTQGKHALLRLGTGRVRLRHRWLRHLYVARNLRRRDRTAQRERAGDGPGDRGRRARGRGDESTDVLALESHAAADRRLGDRPGTVERDDAVGELDREVAGDHLERSLEVELHALAGEGQVEVLDPVGRPGAFLAASDVRHGSLLDVDLGRDRRDRPSCAGAARLSWT